jgi:hypothetical protein
MLQGVQTFRDEFCFALGSMMQRNKALRKYFFRSPYTIPRRVMPYLVIRGGAGLGILSPLEGGVRF